MIAPSVEAVVAAVLIAVCAGMLAALLAIGGLAVLGRRL